MIGQYVNIAARFQTNGRPLLCEAYGNGHINRTFLVSDNKGFRYILQMINTNVFKRPDELMRNILNVTAHLRSKAGKGDTALEYIPARGGGFLLSDGEDHWRMYRFVEGVTYESADEGLMRESGAAFGRFQCLLADFPANELYHTIPRFHDTPHRFDDLHAAVKADAAGRVKSVGQEIEFALAREGFASLFNDLQAAGDLPLRVTHNDTKLNNIVFDGGTGKALCIIDLDTIMPGLSVNDFGDSIRFGASTAAEDEQDLAKMDFSVPLFTACAEGFLAGCGDSLTACEKENLHKGAKMMTLENSVRFLTDYLSGDTYFKTTRKSHNLDRCRAQQKLLSAMERREDEIHAVIKRLTA
jgi:Ser/Thr protein kinase RdoA (MazF antagonist)